MTAEEKTEIVIATLETISYIWDKTNVYEDNDSFTEFMYSLNKVLEDNKGVKLCSQTKKAKKDFGKYHQLDKQ